MGRRVAALRSRTGLTQQEVAYRLAMSRNGLSYVETGSSIPSERTIVLLAGIFGIEPIDLVAGTDYPEAKADRLPLVAAKHTEVGARLAALDLELRWVEELDPDRRNEALDVIRRELQVLERKALEPAEQQAAREARAGVERLASAKPTAESA